MFKKALKLADSFSINSYPSSKDFKIRRDKDSISNHTKMEGEKKQNLSLQTGQCCSYRLDNFWFIGRVQAAAIGRKDSEYPPKTKHLVALCG